MEDRGQEAPQPPQQPPRIIRTHPIYRPLARVVRLGEGIAHRPRTIGVTGVVLGFAVAIAIGTALLSLPSARVSGNDWSLLKSLFTATSAVCVTGLVVVDTGSYWTTFGQGVILGLIQLGGLGIMTSSVLILIVLRRPISFRDRFELQEMSRLGPIHSVSGLVWTTILVTVFLELAGGAAFWLHLRDVDTDLNPIWLAAFHSISAFNNAGFDLMKEFSSLAEFAHEPGLLMTVAALVILGALGVLVLIDVVTKHSWKAFSLNSKIVLAMSGVLLFLGFCGILAVEFSNPRTLEPLSVVDKISSAFFHSAMRTGGFSTVAVGGVKDQTLLLNMGLMFVGGATASTAGGIKVTTLAVLALATMAASRGHEHAAGYGHLLSHRLVYRALAVAFFAMALVFVATMALTITEGFAFQQLLFEVVSAFGTVGLSTGITRDLTSSGQVVIIAVMFVGRLGPLTLAYALARKATEPSYRLPEEDIPIG